MKGAPEPGSSIAAPRRGSPALLSRRDVLRGALACAVRLACGAGAVAELAALTGCGGKAAPAPKPAPAPALPPLVVAHLTDLLPLARLRWLIQARPRELAAIPWLASPIALVVPGDRFDRFAESTGVDLRRPSEVAIASYEDGGAPSTLYLARHDGDRAAIERLFRARLVHGEERVAERPDLVRVSGRIGAGMQSLVLIGTDVVGIQDGGSTSRGPARIASLFATGRLKRSPAVLSQEPLSALATRLGSAPVLAFAVGPFEGELARGARGLLAGATAIGAAARPSARDAISLAVAVAGDFTKGGASAEGALVRAWNDLANGQFGHLYGLDTPVTPPLATHGPDAVAIAVELDPTKLARGIAAATSADVDAIMR